MGLTNSEGRDAFAKRDRVADATNFLWPGTAMCAHRAIGEWRAFHNTVPYRVMPPDVGELLFSGDENGFCMRRGDTELLRVGIDEICDVAHSEQWPEVYLGHVERLRMRIFRALDEHGRLN